ncbi:MAG: hypothetical protein AB7P49_00105 [Bdellovibrionales bacterium]
MSDPLAAPARPLLLHNLLNGPDYSGLSQLDPLIKVTAADHRKGVGMKRTEFNAGHQLRATLQTLFPDHWRDEHGILFDEYDVVLAVFSSSEHGGGAGNNVLTRYAAETSETWENRLSATGLSDAALASGSAHVMVHALRLITAHDYIQLVGRSLAHEKVLIWLHLFCDHHLLSVRYLNMLDFSSKSAAEIDREISSSPDWFRVDPVHIRAPWWGSLPDLSTQMLAHAGFTRPRMPATRTFETQFVAAYVTKQIPKTCSLRNIAETLVQILQHSPAAFALSLDITLIVLCGNYPGAGERLPFALRSHLAAAFLSLATQPPLMHCVWIQMYQRLVYFCLKVYVEFLYLRNPTLRMMLFTDYTLDVHSQIVCNTLSRARDVLRGMPIEDLRGGNLEKLVAVVSENDPDSAAAGSLDFLGRLVREKWEETETLCWGLHVVTTACYQKLMRGPFAYMLGITMHRLLNAVDTIMSVPGVFDESCAEVQRLLDSGVPRSKWSAPLNHFMAVFPRLRPPPPGFQRLRVVNDRHPVLTPEEVQAARALALKIVTRPPTWPYLEFLLALGVPMDFVDKLQALFLSYVAPMTDNMFRRTVACLFDTNPHAFLLVEAVYWHVIQMLRVVVFPLPEHHARAQIEALRRRDGTLPTMPGHGTFTGMFVYCSGCMRVFSDIAQPEGDRQIGSQSFGLRPGEATCRFNPVLGYHVCGRTQHPGCHRPVVMINMLGAGLIFRRRIEYRLCCRCGRVAPYHALRDTTHGLVCHCEEVSAPSAPVPLPRLENSVSEVDAEFTYWSHLREPPPYRVTKRPYCCVCQTPLAVDGLGQATGLRIMVYDDDPGARVRNPVVRCAWVCAVHVRTVTVYCERNNMHPSNILPLSGLMSTHSNFVRKMSSKGVVQHK